MTLSYLFVLGNVSGGVDEGVPADVDPARVGVAAVVQQSHRRLQGAADRGEGRRMPRGSILG